MSHDNLSLGVGEGRADAEDITPRRALRLDHRADAWFARLRARHGEVASMPSFRGLV
jgi:hypothetical protein